MLPCRASVGASFREGLDGFFVRVGLTSQLSIVCHDLHCILYSHKSCKIATNTFADSERYRRSDKGRVELVPETGEGCLWEGRNPLQQVDCLATERYTRSGFYAVPRADF